jgi:hypothetical protein
VNASGKALLTYKVNAVTKRTLVNGAVNALPPSQTTPQVKFDMRPLGPRGKDKKVWSTFKNKCKPYDGPALAFVVVACKAPDGSYWALQRWQRLLPNLGFAPWRPEQAVEELHVSHWTGPLSELHVTLNWAWGGRYQQIVGTYTYAGQPVYGFKATAAGAPLDNWGRNVYLDTLDSAYGSGWKRENSFLAQPPNGRFCYALGPRSPYPGYPASGVRQGTGKRYRLTALGPGVTPIVSVELDSLGDYDAANPAKAQAEATGNALVSSLGFPASQCHT